MIKIFRVSLVAPAFVLLAACGDQGTRLSPDFGAVGANCAEIGRQGDYYGVFVEEFFPRESEFTKAVESESKDLYRKYIDTSHPRNFVRYNAWASHPKDVRLLKAILGTMTHTDVSRFTDSQKKAFFITAYNLMTLDLVLSCLDETEGVAGKPHPDFASIKNIGDPAEGSVWKRERFRWKIAGLKRTLDQLEHETLIPDFNDSRIHLAINCASEGCPPLAAKPFKVFGDDQARNLEQQLQDLSDDFVNETDTEFNGNTITTSMILNWFAKDFENDPKYRNNRDFIKQHVRDQNIKARVDNMNLAFREYSWKLNSADASASQPPPPDIEEDDDSIGVDPIEDESIGSIDLFDQLIRKYRTADGSLRLRELSRYRPDRTKLQDFLASMENVTPDNGNEDRTKALFLNAYNAMTMLIVVENYDDTDPKCGLFETIGGYKEWCQGRSFLNIEGEGLDLFEDDDFAHVVAGRKRTLDEIQHEILAPLGDARVYLATHAMARGSGPFPPEAFTEANIDEQLNLRAGLFVNSRRLTIVRTDHKTVRPSIMFSQPWYGQAFTNQYGSLSNFFDVFLKHREIESVQGYDFVFPDGLEFDWTLNEPR